MSETTLTPRDEDDLTAAELALGLLAGSERRAAERRAAGDAAFRREVDRWDGRLAPLLASAPATAPRPETWRAVAEALPRRPEAERPGPARPRGLVPAFWRPLALGSGALLAASLAALLVPAVFPGPAPAGATLAASIAAGDGLPLFTAVVDPASGEATLIPVRVETGEGRVPELWLIAAEGEAPVSLGVVDPRAPIRVVLPVRDSAAPVLAISLEPPGGSPTGQPTGPVIGTGALRAI